MRQSFTGAGMNPFTLLCWVQGVYFFATGVWPLVSIDTFQLVTGPKVDLWLVRTVAVLICAVALTLLTAAWRGGPAPETVVLGVASAAGLALIDVVYVARGVIAPVYLLDAALEAVLIGAWCLALWAGRAGAAPVTAGPAPR